MNHSMGLQASVEHVISPPILLNCSKFQAEPLADLCRDPVVTVISNSGMWNRMRLHEARIPDTYLFAHSSLLDGLWPTTVCFCSPSLPGSLFFFPLKEIRGRCSTREICLHAFTCSWPSFQCSYWSCFTYKICSSFWKYLRTQIKNGLHVCRIVFQTSLSGSALVKP